MKGLYWYIARHYLGVGRQSGLLSLITWIALGGVTIGVTALVVVVAVMTGMQEDMRNSILESTPHIYVMAWGESLRLPGWEAALDSVLAEDGVVAAAPFALSQVSLIRPGSVGLPARPANLYGVLTDTTRTGATEMERAIISGALSLAPTESGLPPILLGSEMAELMEVEPGDTVIAVSFENLVYSLGIPQATLKRFEVTGAFSTGLYDYDLTNSYTTLAAAQDLIGLAPGTASGIGARTIDPGQAQEIAIELGFRLGPAYSVVSWEVQNRALFDNLRLTKLAMELMLSLIVMVAAFNIVSTLVMVVSDRTREIGILRAMGMTATGIQRVFVLQGVWIGITGTIVGACLGMGIAWLTDAYQLISLPPEIYFVDHLPISLRWDDVAKIVGGSIAIAFVATLYPARRASRLLPVDAIRHE